MMAGTFRVLLVTGLLGLDLTSSSRHHGHQRQDHVVMDTSPNTFVVDLSHVLDENMPILEDFAPFERIKEYRDDGMGARSQLYEFCLDEKLGTHLNTPSMYRHRNESLTTDHIPLDMLVEVPAVVIDLPTPFKFSEPTSEHIGRKDIEMWEKKHGQIPEGAFVLLRSGWSKYWRQTDKFLGNFASEDKQVFPGFSGDAATFLLSQRLITGLGTECVDIELGWKTKHKVKQLLASQGKLSLVALTHLDELPHKGIHLYVAPLKLQGGHGGPTRVFAKGRRHHHHRHDKAKVKAQAVKDGNKSNAREEIPSQDAPVATRPTFNEPNRSPYTDSSTDLSDYKRTSRSHNANNPEKNFNRDSSSSASAIDKQVLLYFIVISCWLAQ